MNDDPGKHESTTRAEGHVDPFETVNPQQDGPTPHVTTPPQQIGRYRIERLLGVGGFGQVYLAEDPQLQRKVAIKVPHPHIISHVDQCQAYLAEARVVAGLDHPNIVPVYDVGNTDSVPGYVVSKYIEGTDLAGRSNAGRLAYDEVARLVSAVADALHYAHVRGLVHRDIKPGNILLGVDGRPYVVDFGLALKENEPGAGWRFAGTPAYMSPEQMRGEGHRVDGRSDIYSLGAVLYELLVGRRAFPMTSKMSLRQRTSGQDPKPPRQIDDRVPKELERICLRRWLVEPPIGIPRPGTWPMICDISWPPLQSLCRRTKGHRVS